MYDAASYQENRRQLRDRLLWLGLPAALMLAATLTSFFARWPEAVTTALCILLCAYCVFSYSLLLSPVIAYGRHVSHALKGRTRQTTGVFMGMEEGAVSREGVLFYPLTINVGGKDKDEDDRLFYFDANLPRPDWQAGERLTLTSYDKMVTAWERAG